MPRYLLELGEGQAPGVLDVDSEGLMVELGAAAKPIHLRPMSKRKLPRLKRSTIERKRRAGRARPDQPLVGSAKFERSHAVEVGRSSVKLVANSYLSIMPRRFQRAYEQLPEINAAVDKAVSKWLAKI